MDDAGPSEPPGPEDGPHSAKDERPRLFPDGTPIGLHLTVERLLSMGPGRSYYLAHNRKPRWYTRMCWNCGHKHNPTTAQACVYCQQVLNERRFLLSCRWAAHQVVPFHRFAAERIRHHAINAPIVLYQYREQLLAFHEIGEEALLVDEPSPLGPRTLLACAWTVSTGLHHLLQLGFELERLGPEHVLVGQDGARLWDLDVARVHPRAIGRGDPYGHEAGRQLGAMLLPYAPLDQREIVGFFQQAAAGWFEDITELQLALRRFARNLRLDTAERRCAALSSVGRKRPLNEDAWAWRRVGEVDLFLVADGMGGYAAGDVASATAVATAQQVLAERLPSTPRTPPAHEALMLAAFDAAHQAVRGLGSATGAPVGTTLVALLLWPDGKAVVAHAGDSRAYRWRAGALTPLTDDHSMVAAMVEAGKLDREQARVHPRSNVLLRYLGGGDDAEPDVAQASFAPGDRVLLCTDGLWGELPEPVLGQRIEPDANPRRVVRTLVGLANEAGGKDNVTGLVIAV